MDRLLELNHRVPGGKWYIEGRAVVCEDEDGTKHTVLPVACGIMGKLSRGQRDVLEFLVEAHNTLLESLAKVEQGREALKKEQQDFRRERWRNRAEAVRR